MKTVTRTILGTIDANGVCRFGPGKHRRQLIIGPVTNPVNGWNFWFGTQPDNTNGIKIGTGLMSIKLCYDDMGDSIDSEFACLASGSVQFAAIETCLMP